MSPFLELKNQLIKIKDIQAAVALLDWDQATYMPPGGAIARGRQIATLSELAHEKFIDRSIGKLLDQLQSMAESLPYDSLEAGLIRITRQDYDRATQVPASFMAKLSEHQINCYETWAKAKAENNFSIVQPALEKTLELSREYANFYQTNHHHYEHIADPLIDLNDYGMTVSKLRPLFTQLRQALVPIVKAISQQDLIDDSCLKQYFPEDLQIKFSQQVITKLGYDFQRGRQDKTLHPFMSSFSIDDARITTRVHENNLNQALFSSIHETGHAFYELGINHDFEGTPLANGTSSGVHESQSRLWENLVGRSRPFWQHFYPQLQQTFPDQLAKVELETFYRAINKVEKSLIRTDADEVTYNLHVMIRFDLEVAMLEGSLEVKDLPEAWSHRYEQDLGIKPPTDSQGVMQDVHWYMAMIGGMFHGYTLGNLLGAQFYEICLKQHPEIPQEISQGHFTTLRQWLGDNIYQYGRLYNPNELIEKVTGTGLSIEPFLRYIKQKYGELYNISI